jgi:protein involved in polysaccharide export with SLBB domain
MLAGCGGGGGSAYSGAPLGGGAPDALRAGDKVTIQLTGVPDQGYFLEKQIPSTGEITLPYLATSIPAVGHTTSELTAEIRTAYMSQKIYTNPAVTVIAEDRFINVGGDVRGPTNVQFRADSTLMTVINAAGGFTEYADRHRVRIIRGSHTFVVDCVKAIQTPGADPAVYPGDQVYVPRTPL